MNCKKEFGELSQFKNRSVELFRSSDQIETAKYYTENCSKAYFELLRFELNGGDQQVYIRFPNTDYFVEMCGGGIGSSRGSMQHSSGKDAWKDEYSAPFKIYSQKDDLLLSLGSTNFNFMRRVAFYDKGNPFNRPFPNVTSDNYGEIEDILSMKYLKLPNVRKIHYCYRLEDKFIVIDAPKFNFKYSEYRFFMVDANVIKEFEIKDLERYRDGGTTIITVIDKSGNEHVFYSPSPLSSLKKDVTWDGVALIEVDESEQDILSELINKKC